MAQIPHVARGEKVRASTINALIDRGTEVWSSSPWRSTINGQVVYDPDDGSIATDFTSLEDLWTVDPWTLYIYGAKVKIDGMMLSVEPNAMDEVSAWCLSAELAPG